MQARFGKSSHDIIFPPSCNQTPFGGSARPVPGTIQAAALPKAVRVEIDAIARVG